jgi:hypothetical protein
MVEQLHLDFPVAYGLEVPRDAEKIGAFWEARRGIFHATAFLLGAKHQVVQASYSTGPLGRLAAEEVLSLLQFLKGRIVPGDTRRLTQYLAEIRQQG